MTTKTDNQAGVCNDGFGMNLSCPIHAPKDNQAGARTLREDYLGYCITAELNAEIVRRYNLHAQLLEACKAARSAITFGGKIDWNAINDQLMAAITAAEKP